MYVVNCYEIAESDHSRCHYDTVGPFVSEAEALKWAESVAEKGYLFCVAEITPPANKDKEVN